MELLNIALPKGRLGEKVYACFKAAGYPCPSIEEENRKLIFENTEAGVRYFWVKPSISASTTIFLVPLAQPVFRITKASYVLYSEG